MPYRHKTPCRQPGCPNLCEPGKQYCPEHMKIHPEATRSAAGRGYGKRWQKRSRLFLQRPENIFCAECRKHGKYVRATVVDHIVPHRGDPELFWDEGNWQPLCKACHDRKTGREDSHPVYHY